MGGPLAAEVPLIWQNTPTPYGPVFVRVASGVAKVVSSDVVAGVLGMRVVALAGLALMVYFLPRLAESCGVGPSGALWLGALNPLVLLHLIAGAHNDALMLGLLVAGLATRWFIPLAAAAPEGAIRRWSAFVCAAFAIVVLPDGYAATVKQAALACPGGGLATLAWITWRPA